MAVWQHRNQHSRDGTGRRRATAPSRRFAYLMHRADATLVNPPRDLEPYREAMAATCASAVPVLSDIEVTTADGRSTFGDVILAGNPEPPYVDAADLDGLQQGVQLALARGAELIGFSAGVTSLLGGGRGLGNAVCVNGIAVSAAAVDAALAEAQRRLGRRPSNATAAVLGAAGKLGTAVAARLAESVEQLVLIADLSSGAVAGRQALLSAGAEVCRYLIEHKTYGGGPFAGRLRELACEAPPTYRNDYLRLAERLVAEGLLTLAADRRRLLLADLVVIADGWGALDSRLLPPASLVCDLRRPRALSRAEAADRPDVMVIDPVSFEQVEGECPTGLFGTRGLPASLVEALVCALDPEAAAIARHACHSPWRSSGELQRRAANLGFQPVPLCSFQTRIDEARWAAMGKLRVLPRRAVWGAGVRED